jgi:hydrogenase expression/formation protein HypC
MCLSIPSKVVSIDSDKNSAIVETMGVSREVGLDLMDEGSVHVGDYVLIHIGFVMNKIDEEDALASLMMYKEILGALDEEGLKKTILEDDDCENRT